MIWQELTSKALDRASREIPVILPVAAIEQHGPHLPLATDRLIAEHFVGELNRELGDRVLILPTVAVGCSVHHMDFAGSLTLSHETFAAVVSETLDSAVHHGFKRLVILNSHGGNLGIVQVLCEKLGAAYPECVVVAATWWKLAAEALMKLTMTGPGGVGHACEFETSLMEVIAPHLIDRKSVQPGANVKTFDWAEGDMLRGARATLYRSMKQMTPNGVYGRPDQASREKGMEITRVVVTALTKLVRDLGAESR